MIVSLLAQTSGDSSTGVVEGLIGGAGVAGIWLVTILIGWMHPNTSMRREQERADKAETKVDRLTEVYIAEVIPALNSAAEAVAASRRRDLG